MKKQQPKMTVGEFKELLSGFNDDDLLDFSTLDFYRLKHRGTYVQVEFNQSVYRDEKGNVVVENHG